MEAYNMSHLHLDQMLWHERVPALQSLQHTPFRLQVVDIIIWLLVLGYLTRLSDYWGFKIPKPSPLLFIKVREGTPLEDLPKQSRNIADLLKVRFENSTFCYLG